MVYYLLIFYCTTIVFFDISDQQFVKIRQHKWLLELSTEGVHGQGVGQSTAAQSRILKFRHKVGGYIAQLLFYLNWATSTVTISTTWSPPYHGSTDSSTAANLINQLEVIHHIPLAITNNLFQVIGKHLPTHVDSGALSTSPTHILTALPLKKKNILAN